MAQQVSTLADSGSNYQFFDKKIRPDIKRSRFDCSYLNSFSCKQGYIYPIYLQFTQPNENYDISIQSVIRTVNTPVVPLFSRQRAFFHYYWMPMSALWKNWQTFLDKGRSGNVAGIIPKISASMLDIGHAFDSTTTSSVSTTALKKYIGRGSLFDFLIGSLPSSLIDIFNENEYFPTASLPSNVLEVNALPFMMYQRIYRDCYMNQNLNPDEGVAGSSWFPYDDADFRLNGGMTATYTSLGRAGSDTPKWSVNLLQLRTKNFADDYFTSARLTPVRGDEPTLDFNFQNQANGLPVGINVNDLFYSLNIDGMRDGSSFGTLHRTVNLNPGTGNSVQNTIGYPFSSDISSVVFGGLRADNLPLQSSPSGASYPLVASGSYDLNFKFSAPDIRALFSATRIAEKSMRTDGSYGEFISTFFGKTPRSSQDYRPYYIGGSYQPIVYTEVLQTSESANTPLGQVGGKGISSDSGNIGSFFADDYGFIMGLMSIVPDTIYTTGVNRTLLYEVQEDFPLPERMELGPQAILNKEIFWSGDDEVDNDILGYIDRFDELRYRANEVHGKMADFDNETFSPYTQAREITTTPTLSQQFVELSEANINNRWLTAPEEDVFAVKVRNVVHAVKPMPYQSIPAGLI